MANVKGEPMDIPEVDEQVVLTHQNWNMQAELPLQSLKTEQCVEDKEENSGNLVNLRTIPSVEEIRLIDREIISQLVAKERSISTAKNKNSRSCDSFTDSLTTDEAVVSELIKHVKSETLGAEDACGSDRIITRSVTRKKRFSTSCHYQKRLDSYFGGVFSSDEETIENVKLEPVTLDTVEPEDVSMQDAERTDGRGTENERTEHVTFEPLESEEVSTHDEINPPLGTKEPSTTDNIDQNRLNTITDRLTTDETATETEKMDHLSFESSQSDVRIKEEETDWRQHYFNVHHRDIALRQQSEVSDGKKDDDENVPGPQEQTEFELYIDRATSEKQDNDTEQRLSRQGVNTQTRRIAPGNQISSKYNCRVLLTDIGSPVKLKKADQIQSETPERSERVCQEESTNQAVPLVQEKVEEANFQVSNKDKQELCQEASNIQKTLLVQEKVEEPNIKMTKGCYIMLTDIAHLLKQNIAYTAASTSGQELCQKESTSQKTALVQKKVEEPNLQVSNKGRCYVMLTDIGHLIKQGTFLVPAKTSEMSSLRSVLHLASPYHETHTSLSSIKSITKASLYNQTRTLATIKYATETSPSTNTAPLHGDIEFRNRRRNKHRHVDWSINPSTEICKTGKDIVNFRCEVCNATFVSKSTVHAHLRNHITRIKQFPCRVCGVKFTDKSHLQRHLRNHAGRKPYSCNVCRKAFAQLANLQRHKTIHTTVKKPKPYSCDICWKTFTQAFNLQEHERIHTGKKDYTCDVCGKGFAQANGLHQHKKIHTDIKPFLCDLCPMAFYTKYRLKTHKRIHTAEKPFRCDLCGKGFRKDTTLQAHKAIHSGEAPYRCSICGKGCQRTTLYVHMRIHTGEKPYSCDVCGKAFRDRSHYRIHRRIHTGERPYTCGICGKSFRQKANLTTHLTSHTGETPFSCDLCGKAYRRASNLRKHKRVHHIVKPFLCNVCGMGFTQPDDLREHKRVHTDGLHFHCDICGKAYIHRSNLWRHRRSHTKETPFSCDVCGKAYTRRANLKLHIRTHFN